uniref:Fibronectin type-III domain-containing protein n=1 Tax=viral metagenome TaxID=1070528 RepID=A0A6C0L8H1_9ZZZZ
MSTPSYWVAIAEPGNVIASATSTSITFTGLTANTSYLVTVFGIYGNNACTGPSTLTITTSANNVSPTSIDGNALWFDAADATTITKSGTAVSQWNDKSVNGYSVVQATSANQPVYTASLLNGQAGIVLSNTAWLAQTASNMPLFTGSTGTTAFFVARNDSSQPSGGWDIFNTLFFTSPGGSGNTIRYHFSFSYGTTQGVGLRIGAPSEISVGQAGVVTLGTNAVVGFTISSNSAVVSVNGTSTSYTGYSLLNANNIGTQFVFGENRQNNVVRDIAIYEMVGFNRQLSTYQQQIIEGYLAWKWALQGNLPSTHPYKSSKPVPSALYNPLAIPGCILWLDAADTASIVLSGSNVTQWNDKSNGGYNFTQATTASQPTYSAMSNGKNGINLGTSKSMANSSIPFTTNYTIFAIGYTASNGYGRLLNGGSDGLLFFGAGNGVTQFATFTGNGGWTDTNTNSPATSVANLCLMELTNNNTSTGLIPYVNGTALTGKNGTTITFTGLTLGQYSGGQYWNGYVAEILIYNSVLTTIQRQQVEGYLASKWAIQSSLPGAHPYYSIAPTSTTLSPFNPMSVRGCIAWYDAMDQTTITQSSGAVSQWADKSGYGSDLTQATAGNKPTYVTDGIIKGPTVSFASANSTFLSGGTNYALSTNGFAMFSVVKFNDAASTNGAILNKALAGQVTGKIIFIRESGSINMGPTVTGGDTGLIYTDTYTANTYRIICSIYNRTAATKQIYQNGTLVANATGVTAATQPNTYNFIMGAYNNGSGTASPPYAGFYLNGNIAEILCYSYSTDMTSTTQQAIEGYLAWKWGIQSYLPANHVYYSVAPTATALTGGGGGSAPSAPTGVSGTASNSTTINVSFTAASGATSYTVTSSPGSFTGTGSASPIAVSGLSSNTSYTFAVTATNSYGTSSASTASSAVITFPGAPTIGTATASGSTGASVTFTGNTGGGAAAITSYTVTSSSGSFTGTGSSSPITVGGLSTGIAYTFTVTETTSVGTSTASSASNSVTLTAAAGGTGSGTGTFTTSTSGSYTVFTYTGNGTFTMSGAKTLSLLAVAGGGGAGLGGGGAGGVIQSTVTLTAADTITITVGGGGAARTDVALNSTFAGGNTTAIFATATSNNKTAIGGGAGASYNNYIAGAGGSGGGSRAYTGGNQGAGTAGQGNRGGSAGNNSNCGGGGAGAQGVDSTSDGQATAGGNGVICTLAGINSKYPSIYWGGGGGGGAPAGFTNAGGAGGFGGGASGTAIGGTQTAADTNGFTTTTTRINGANNTGGGGGGANATQGGVGGSGIVVIAYLT